VTDFIKVELKSASTKIEIKVVDEYQKVVERSVEDKTR
jgi:hypothetical protein